MSNRLCRLLAVVIAVLVLAAPVALAAGPAERKPDKLHPVAATNVQLAQKLVVRGPQRPAPSKPNKGRTTAAATGILGESLSGARYALVVGISDYPGTVNDLALCDDDARDVVDTLRTVYGFSADHIIALIDEEGTEASGNLVATRAAVLGAIEYLETLVTPDDEVVLFFSSHGMNGLADDGDKERLDEALALHDGQRIVPLWDGELRDALAGFATSRIIIIFDTCYAGGMKTDLQADGRLVAMACTESGLSYEVPALGNGEFTYWLVDRGMLAGLADTYDSLGGPDVTVEEAYDYAVANVRYDKPTIGDSFPNDLLP